MSATKHWTIWCDWTGCAQWTDHGAPTAGITRRLAKRMGWRRVRIGKTYWDYCPDHTDHTEGET